MAAETKLTFVANDTLYLPVTWKETNGDPYDLTGYTAKLTVKSSYAAATPLLEVTGTIATPASGQAIFEGTVPSAAGRYVYDVEMKSVSYTKTILRGVFEIQPEVTSA